MVGGLRGVAAGLSWQLGEQEEGARMSPGWVKALAILPLLPLVIHPSFQL